MTAVVSKRWPIDAADRARAADACESGAPSEYA